MSARVTSKKVRLACQRCRVKRIKCDGQTPACSNCAKVGEACLDIDGNNADQLIPRNFAGEVRARIQWLEDIIRNRLPDVDLSSGPQVEMTTSTGEIGSLNQAVTGTAIGSATSSLKRRQDAATSLTRESFEAGDGSTEDDDPIAEKVHSLAHSLGMVSLNSDSTQRHYMGSSSGVLFTDLIRMSPSTVLTSGLTPSQDPDRGDVNLHAADETNKESLEQRHRALVGTLRKEMPCREEASTLLDTYIRWVHPEFPVLDLECLSGAIDALYHCLTISADESMVLTAEGWPENQPEFLWNARTAKPGALDPKQRPPPLAVVAFTVFMLFSISSIIKIRRRIYGFSPDRYYRVSRHFAPEAFSQTSLSTIQALSMLIIHCMHTPTEASIWTLVNIGMAQCVELGIHRDLGEEGKEVQQLNRFVFYTMYSLDRSVASIQGRPPGLRDEAFDVKLPEVPLDRETTDQQSNIQRAIVVYSRFNFELQQIVSDIKTSLYHLPKKSKYYSSTVHPYLAQTQISTSLNTWWDQVQDENFETLGVEAHQAHVWKIRLRVRYHKTAILLFQPSQTIRNPPDPSIEIVFACATSILEDFQLLYDSGALDFGWRSVQGIFSAGATLVYAFWTCRSVQETVDATGISQSLRTCLGLLAISGEWWRSARASQAVFGPVVDLTIQKIHSRPPRAKQPRLDSFRANQIRSTIKPHTSRANEVAKPSSTSAAGEASWTPAGSSAQNLISRAGLPSSNADLLGESQNDTWMSSSHGVSVSHDASVTWDTDPTMDAGEFPEIEEFLTDFDRSHFHWNLPADKREIES